MQQGDLSDYPIDRGFRSVNEDAKQNLIVVNLGIITPLKEKLVIFLI